MSDQTKPPLPSWATLRCDICGQITWDGAMWSSRTRLHTCGYDRAACERTARRTDADLAIEYVLAHQALIEAEQTIGRFISETPDEDYADVKKLQALLFEVIEVCHRGSRGMRLYDVERAS